jgi:hypothetical protein
MSFSAQTDQLFAIVDIIRRLEVANLPLFAEELRTLLETINKEAKL